LNNKVAPALVTELEKRVGMQLEQAALPDLLIPSFNRGETAYDVDLVQRLVEHFLVQEQTESSSPSRGEAAHDGVRISTVSNAKARVARLIDGYLTEVSRDRNLSLTKFQVLAEALPESARSCDDGLYRAVDSYLKVCRTFCYIEFQQFQGPKRSKKYELDFGSLVNTQTHNQQFPVLISHFTIVDSSVSLFMTIVKLQLHAIFYKREFSLIL
jgi:NPH3 family